MRKVFGDGFVCGVGPFFYGAGGWAFLQGVLEKNRCSVWCFGGEVVVECVVNVVS
jgi:hypothetical protein